MNLFDAIFADDSEPETPELTEADHAAFDRPADIELCVHATGIRVGAGIDGQPMIVIRITGHTRDQEDLEDKAHAKVIDFAMCIEDASVFLNNASMGLRTAIESDPLARLMLALLEGETNKLN